MNGESTVGDYGTSPTKCRLADSGTTVDATMTAFPLLVQRVRVRFYQANNQRGGCDGK